MTLSDLLSDLLFNLLDAAPSGAAASGLFVSR
jgi:hypothetical protein